MSGDADQLLYYLNKIAEQQVLMVRMLKQLVDLAEAEKKEREERVNGAR